MAQESDGFFGVGGREWGGVGRGVALELGGREGLGQGFAAITAVGRGFTCLSLLRKPR